MCLAVTYESDASEMDKLHAMTYKAADVLFLFDVFIANREGDD